MLEPGRDRVPGFPAGCKVASLQAEDTRACTGSATLVAHFFDFFFASGGKSDLAFLLFSRAGPAASKKTVPDPWLIGDPRSLLWTQNGIWEASTKAFNVYCPLLTNLMAILGSGPRDRFLKPPLICLTA